MGGLLGLLAELAKRPRVFISYHHAGDQRYYDILSNLLHDQYALVTDRSLDEEVDSANSEYVMRRIREGYITGTSCTLVLCGEETASRKYVDWEIKATLDAGHSLIGIALEPPGSHYLKPDRFFDNLMTRYAGLVDWFEVVGDPATIQKKIAAAALRSRDLIDNSRQMKARNG